MASGQETITGSTTIGQALLEKIPDDLEELFLTKSEVETARLGEPSLSAKISALQTLITTVTTEVTNARDGEDTLLAQINSLQSLVSAVATEVTDARDGEDTLLAQIDILQNAIAAVSAASGVKVSSNDTTVGFLNGKLVTTGAATIAKTVNYTVTPSDLKTITFVENSDGGNETLSVLAHRTFTNNGATGDIAFSLPTGSEGDAMNFRVVENHYIRVDADGTENFRYGSNQGAAGGYIRSEDPGTCFTIEFLGGEWVITKLVGLLKADE